MSIYINEKSLTAVAEIVSEYGLPTPCDPRHDELFGEYSTQSFEGFIHYDAESTSGTAIASRFGRNIATVPAEDQMRVSDLMSELKYIRPEGCPEESTRPASLTPFTYCGWNFAWMFFPELKRWELAVFGRA